MSNFFKGFLMGGANVVPGVSGGTIAFITGIYERLIKALKSINGHSLKLLCSGEFRAFFEAIDVRFLLAIILGAFTGIVSLARLLEAGFQTHPVLVWATFFGLILASVPMVGKRVKHWSVSSIGCLLVGLFIALSLAWMKPVEENTQFFYLILCGAVAMVSMIIPGLSGSFVLLLMGNYQLIMIQSIAALRSGEWTVLGEVFLPVGIGALCGLFGLVHFLNWLFNRYHDQAVSLITGFVAGSLLIIWPWKETLERTIQTGDEIKVKTEGYANWFFPEISSKETWIALLCMIGGALLVFLMEKTRASNDGAS